MEEILKAVFPLLEGRDLAMCMLVSKQWLEIARDEYFWKTLCAKRWPSCCRRSFPTTLSYYKLYKTFYKQKSRGTFVPPRLSYNDLEFFVDIWAEEKLVFSKVVPGSVLKKQSNLLVDISGYLLVHLPPRRRFNITYNHSNTVSVLVGRKDTNKVACVVDKSKFEYVKGESCMALAHLDSPGFMPGITASVSLLYMDCNDTELIGVFGIELDLLDADEELELNILWFLECLDWK